MEASRKQAGAAEPPAAGGNRIADAVRSNALMFPLIGVLGFATSIVVARALAPALFALYAAAIALRGSVQFLADLGTGQASSRIFAELKHRGARRQAWRLFLRLGALRIVLLTLLTLVVVAAPDFVARVFDLRADERYFLTFLVGFAFTEVAAGLGYYLLIGTLDQRSVNRVMVAQGIVQPVLILAAAAAGLGLEGVLGGVLAGSLVKAVAMNVIAVSRLRAFEQRSEGIVDLGRAYSRIATGSVAGKLATFVHSRQIITVAALSAASRPAVAVFALAYDLATQVLGYAISPASGVVLPAFAIDQSDHARTARLFALTTRGAAMLVLPPAMVLTVLTPVLVPAVFGAAYEQAVPYLFIFAPAMALELVLTISAANLMVARDDLLGAFTRIKSVTLVLGIVYFVALGADLLLVAGLMMAIRLGSAIALHLAIGRRGRVVLDVRWLLTALGAAVAAGAVAMVPVLALDDSVAQLGLGGAIALLGFAALAWLLRLVPSSDVMMASRVHPLAGRLLALLVRA